MSLDKSSRNKKEAKPITTNRTLTSPEQTPRNNKEPNPMTDPPTSTPESNFEIENFNKHKEEERARKQRQQTQDETKKKRRGRPRKNKATKNIRISDDAVAYINAYRNAANLESQDEAIIEVFSAYGKGDSMASDIKRMYNVFLEAKGLK